MATAPASKQKNWDKKIQSLTFLGVVGVSDPLRLGVKEAVQTAQKAGVSIKVITGDYRITAEAIMKELDIIINDPKREILIGNQLETMSEKELNKRVQEVKLFSRVTPHQKLAIVKALQANGESVAMTGDGVNDSLALKKAEIAIVVESASDVAKETADLVLLDSNLQTIVAAIEEGRGIFQNIRKVALYLLSDSFTEIFLIMGSILLGLPLPLTAAQILWINIVSDGLPHLALSIEPKDSNLMQQRPRRRTESIVDREVKQLIGIISFVTAILSLGTFYFILKTTGNLLYAQSITFAMVGTDSLIYVFSCRSLSKSIFNERLFKNPWLIVAVLVGFSFQLTAIYHPLLQRTFNVLPLGIYDWVLVAMLGLLLIAAIEGVKLFYLKNNRKYNSSNVYI